jgi:hypothetical protein
VLTASSRPEASVLRGLDAAVAEAAHPANPAAGIVVVLHRLAVHAHDPTRLAAAVVLAVGHRVAEFGGVIVLSKLLAESTAAHKKASHPGVY